MKKLPTPLILATLSILIIVGLVSLLRTTPTASSSPPLLLYCAAGMKPAIAEIIESYTAEINQPVEVQYGGSGTLLSNIEVSKRGDLYLAADQSYIEIAEKKGLTAETFELASIRPVIITAKGNPKNILTLTDLSRPDIKLSLGHPQAASIGKQTQKILSQINAWKPIEKAVTSRGVFKPTVPEVANAVKLGAVDAGIVWDATARQYPDLEIISLPLFEKNSNRVTLSILNSSTTPTAAITFARYASAHDRGLTTFEKNGFTPVKGDKWEPHPEITLFSGGVNRVAIDDTVKAFASREGVTINTIYNGCGILVGQMKAGAHMDAYFACDTSYMEEVYDRLGTPTLISETEMVLLTAKDNPHQISKLEHLALPGVKVAVSHPRYSALGGLTENLLKETGLYQSIQKNITYGDSPTADLIVTRILTGREDVGIVYRANTMHITEKLTVIPIKHPAATAQQPIAISKNSHHHHLIQRLISTLTTENSKQKFLTSGFRWRHPSDSTDSP